MDILVQQLANGLAVGGTYALMAVGYNLTFGVLRVVNLAYGETFMVAGYSVVALWGAGIRSAPVLCAVAIGAAILTGLVVHSVAVVPLGNVSNLKSPRHLQVLVSTVGCSLILQNLALVTTGGFPQRFPDLLPARSMQVLGISIRTPAVLAVLISLSSTILLVFLLSRTSFGLRLRGLADNRELARFSGAPTRADEFLCVGLSAALAGVAALTILQLNGAISPTVGASFGLKGLIALIVGRPGNMGGAVSAGFGLGVLEVAASAYLSSAYKDAVAFGVLVLFLSLVGRSGSMLKAGT